MLLHQHKRGESRKKLWQTDEEEKLVERWWKSLKQGVLPWKCSIKQYQGRPNLDIGDFCGALQHRRDCSLNDLHCTIVSFCDSPQS